jgi:hypothetical protein
MSVLSHILEEAEGTIARYVVLPDDHASAALALFIAHTHALDGAHATPYLLIISPEKRSGKTRLLEVLELLVARPWTVNGSLSEAALFRKIDKDRPTLLLDEIDALFGSHTDRTEPLRAILNAGNRPGAKVPRCVGEGAKLDVRDFEVFSPKVLAGIDTGHKIPETIRDRAIAINMARRTQAEPVDHFRHRDARTQTESFRAMAATWAAERAAELAGARPETPDALDDRAAEAWEPLLAIADAAGSEWPSRARSAAVALSGSPEAEERSLGALLLEAIRDRMNGADRISSAELLAAINEDEDLPFGGWRDGRGLDGRGLAKLLRPYGARLKSRTVRFDDGAEPEIAKGFLREQFEEIWARWLPTPDTAVTTVTAVTGAETVTQKPHGNADVTDVTDVTATSGAGGAVTDPSGTNGRPQLGCPSHRDPVPGCRYCVGTPT